MEIREDITIEGVTDALNKLEDKPKAEVLHVTVCLHRLQDARSGIVVWIGELAERFPKITFIRSVTGSDHGVEARTDTGSEAEKAIYGEPLPDSEKQMKKP
ncbi:MAG: hypothetical protein ACLTS1_20095 [Coprococcus sp.]